MNCEFICNMFALWHYERADSVYIFSLYHGVFSRLDRIVDYDCCRRYSSIFQEHDKKCTKF